MPKYSVTGKSSKSKKSKLKGRSKRVLNDIANVWSDVTSGLDGDRASRAELMDHHRHLSAECRELQNKLTALRDTLQELRSTFDISKTYCCCFKYTDMNAMVETALISYRKLLERTDWQPEFKDPRRDSERQRLLSPISKLLYDSRELAIKEHARLKQEEAYSKMNSGDLERALLEAQGEHAGLAVQVEDEETKFERLESAYVTSKQYCWFRRYGKLKRMIRAATTDCLTDSYAQNV